MKRIEYNGFRKHIFVLHDAFDDLQYVISLT